MLEIPFRIDANGESLHAYNDKMIGLRRKFGEGSIRRASHVEPQGCKFTADMKPMGGPVLGPFDTHQQALKEENAWLRRHL